MGFLRKSINEIHEALQKNEVTPFELVREAITKARDDKNNAFEFICDKHAYEQVALLKDKDPRNLLWGIPFVVKDNFYVDGIPTSASSNILEGFIPAQTAEVIKKLEDAGAILIGKTTLDEFGMGGHGTSGHKGYVYNPWDLSRRHEIGGSSSGSAAAISSGIVPIAIGSDTGDSVRKPASNACLVGFKPTWDLISRDGLIPFAEGLDHVAFFARSVKDSRLILNAINAKNETYFIDNCSSVKFKNFAIIKEIYDCFPKNDVLNAFNQLIEKIKDEGGIINFVHVDKNLCKAIWPTYFVISSSEATKNIAPLSKYAIVGEKDFSLQIKRRLLVGGFSQLEENKEELLLKAQKIRRVIANKVGEILRENDVIILPASPTVAPEFDEKANNDIDLEIANNYMAIANFAGTPSMTIPMGFSNGLPFGVNLTGKLFDEENLMNIALHIEDMNGIRNLSCKEK